jgi:hypothetical protein
MFLYVRGCTIDLRHYSSNWELQTNRTRLKPNIYLVIYSLPRRLLMAVWFHSGLCKQRTQIIKGLAPFPCADTLCAVWRHSHSTTSLHPAMDAVRVILPPPWNSLLLVHLWDLRCRTTQIQYIRFYTVNSRIISSFTNSGISCLTQACCSHISYWPIEQLPAKFCCKRKII